MNLWKMWFFGLGAILNFINVIFFYSTGDSVWLLMAAIATGFCLYATREEIKSKNI